MSGKIFTISGGAGEEGTEAEEKTPEQLQAEAAALEAEKNKGTPLTVEGLNDFLAQRDQQLINTVQRGTVEIITHMLQQNPNNTQVSEADARREAERAQEALQISPEEFWKNPQAAMEKFYEVKTAALKTDLNKRPQGQGPDHGLTALAETRVQGLWNNLSQEDKDKYGPFLQEVIKQTDIRVLADAKGIDSVWRLTKSHADDVITERERRRTEKNQKANMLGGNGLKAEPESKITLTAEESAIAEAFGLSPELYKKNSVPVEVEPGGNRNKKK